MRKGIEQIVEQACAADTNIFGYDIWTHRILKVIENTKRLAPLFDADREIVEFAALLHDYASIKDKALYADHHLMFGQEVSQCFSVGRNARSYFFLDFALKFAV